MTFARKIADGLSISRIVLAFVFLVSIRLGNEYFWVSFAILMVAQLTDQLDGYIIRRFDTPTLNGYMLDSLGDKIFYVAAIVAFTSEGIYGMLLSWALITREIILYIMRICYPEKTQSVKSIHIYSRIHGLFIRISFLIAMASFSAVFDEKTHEHLQYWTSLTGWLAVAIGAYGLFRFMALK